MTRTELINVLLPRRGLSTGARFNVFDVMHHGTHEKQLSNVFAWLLDIGGTHNFESFGQRLFVELVNETRSPYARLPEGPYSVDQEANTAEAGEAEYKAGIVLECDTAVIVVENFRTSDGHDHGYENYPRFARRDGKTGAVVLLCQVEDRAAQDDGWENASVVTSGVPRPVRHVIRGINFETGEEASPYDDTRLHDDIIALLRET